MRKTRNNRIIYVLGTITSAFVALAMWGGVIVANGPHWRTVFIFIGSIALLAGLANSAMLIREIRKVNRPE